MMFGPAGNRRFSGSGRPRGAQQTIPKDGGRRRPPFGMVFGAAGAAHTSKIDDFRPAQKPCIENQSIVGHFKLSVMLGFCGLPQKKEIKEEYPKVGLGPKTNYNSHIPSVLIKF
jgi:hypothetical protein